MDEILKIFITALIALISWLIKDLFFGSIAKRSEGLRREWEFRLKEVWSPLYYWSGVVFFDSKQAGWDKHGVKELESLLSKFAYLIPRDHYYTLIKVVEIYVGQKTTAPAENAIISAREYFYNQIELLNYLLYRSSDLNDVGSRSNVLYPYKFILRVISGGLIHILIWLGVAGFLISIYWLFDQEIYWPLIIIGVLFLILILADMRKRSEIARNIISRVKKK